MLFAQFEAAFPRLMDQVYAGYTLHRAVQEYPLKLDYGQFNRWVLRDPGRKAIYEEAQEYRAEVWADRMIEHAEGTVNANGVLLELDRSRFANDTYKFLMGRQNKKRYGESKTLEVEHRISISAALEASKQRVVEAIDAEVVVDQLGDGDELRAIISGDDGDDQDEDS